MMGADCEREYEQGFWGAVPVGLRLAQPPLAVFCTITLLSSVKREGELVKQIKTKSQQLTSYTNLLPPLCHPFSAGFLGCPYAKSNLAGLRL